MNILLVNPPVYDFACHDLWMKPLGLLYIAGILKNAGGEVHLVDSMDRLSHFNSGNPPKSDEYGCGRHYNIEVEKPAALKFVPRKYKRYGLSKDSLIVQLKSLPTPNVILVSSGMTYWYPGVIETISMMKDLYPSVPVILGGIYATLCNDHAKKYSKADCVFPGSDLKKLVELINSLGGGRVDISCIPGAFSEYPAPDYELYREVKYIALRTSIGCVFDCSYCAVKHLNPGYDCKPPEKVIAEILHFREKYGIKDFAFYDDALLCGSAKRFAEIFGKIAGLKTGCRFHTPNGLHARFITEETAHTMYAAGFVKPRLALETSNEIRQKDSGNKVTNAELSRAVKLLKSSGYKSNEIIVYIMGGIPGQSFEEIERTVDFLAQMKVRISLSEYSPIPFTRDWQKIPDNVAREPLLHNNSVFPMLDPVQRQKMQSIKDVIKRYNCSLQS